MNEEMMASPSGDDIKKVMTEATIGPDIYGRLFGIGRSATYRAARNGPHPVVRIGNLLRWPTPPIRKDLCLDPGAPTAP